MTKLESVQAKVDAAWIDREAKYKAFWADKNEVTRKAWLEADIMYGTLCGMLEYHKRKAGVPVCEIRGHHYMTHSMYDMQGYCIVCGAQEQ